MAINTLTQEQRKALACTVWRVLAELWLDQHGLEGNVTVVEKGAAA